MKQKKTDESGRARNYALRLLKVRLRSKRELFGRLKQKGYSPNVIEEVIHELESANLIDDKRFATFFASDQLEFHVKGQKYIRYKLMMLGVESDIIEEALKDAFENADLSEIFHRFVRSHGFKSEKEVSELLIRRGFDPQTVHQILLEIYEERRCEDESGNYDHSDIRSHSDFSNSAGIPLGKDKGTQRTEKGKGKRK
ncbi:regulatory protein RecX [Mesoaciditoga sp.]